MELPPFIYPGALCRMRNGRKARVLCTDRVPSVHLPLNKVAGLAFLSPSEEGFGFWTIEGRWNYDGSIHNYDLVGPWIEPVPWDWATTPPFLNYLWRQAYLRRWFLTRRQPIMGERCWLPKEACFAIPEDYAPNWTGDWKDSLTVRPGFPESQQP